MRVSVRVCSLQACSHTCQLVATRTCTCYPLSIRLAVIVASSARLQEFPPFSINFFHFRHLAFRFYVLCCFVGFMVLRNGKIMRGKHLQSNAFRVCM